MSNEKILSFLNECKVNRELQEKLMKLSPEDADGLIEIANEAGYGFTAEEWAEYQNMRSKKSELTEDDLDKVSGGGFFGLTSCPKEYDFLLCEASYCPHLHILNNNVFKKIVSCDKGYFGDQNYE
jgi:predicted ribosomally synthesized peptide with nif11-like leader